MNGDTTHVVELTPAGRAAVAIVLIAGPNAVCAVEQCFVAKSGRPIGAAPIGRIILGRWGSPEGEELIVCRRAANRVEVHCHGGTAAVGAVVARLTAEGCRPISWQDWLRTSEGDPLRAAAHVALADAPTARTAAILLDQWNGSLAAAVRQAIEAVSAKRWSQAGDNVDALLARADVGRHLTSPWQVVLAGPPNVGKSSLLNALAGFQRAIVSPVPGTTRDVVTLATAIDGWPVLLADTAGLREARDELEAAGIGLAGGAIAGADLLIVVHDATAAHRSSSVPMTVPEMLAAAKCVHVVNKVDLISADQRSLFSGFSPLFTSAVTGEGMATLVAAIGRALVPNPPATGDAVPFAAEQIAALTNARRAIEERDAATACETLQSLLVAPH